MRLEASGTDDTVLAHHPNKYVRAVALRRLKVHSSPLGDADLERVVAAAGDYDRLFSPDCVDLVSSWEYRGQGIDVAQMARVTLSDRVSPNGGAYGESLIGGQLRRTGGRRGAPEDAVASAVARAARRR